MSEPQENANGSNPLANSEGDAPNGGNNGPADPATGQTGGPDGPGGPDGLGAARIFTWRTELPLNAVMQNVFNFLGTAAPGGPAKKKRHFTKDAIDHLEPVKLSDLAESDRQCPICFDAFDEYTTSPVDSGATPDVILPKPFEGYQFNDPSISFPEDETAHTEIQYDLKSEECYKSIPKSLHEAHYAVKLPQCQHVFGRSCIAEWLKSNVSCPLCRKEVVPELSESNSSGQAMIFYPIALTEVFVPIDWTGPISSGYNMDDPPVNFPAPGEGSSMGRRTGPDPS